VVTNTAPAQLRTSEGVDETTAALDRLEVDGEVEPVAQHTIKSAHHFGIGSGELITTSSTQLAASRL
jgi:hypothetical protein